MIRNDGSNTCRASITFRPATFNMSSRFTCVAVPVKLDFLIFAYPVTTTSSKAILSSFITTRKSLRTSPVFNGNILTSCVSIPTKVNTSVTVSADKATLKRPSALVATPVFVPFITTVTPGNGFPISSTTIPLINRTSFLAVVSRIIVT